MCSLCCVFASENELKTSVGQIFKTIGRIDVAVNEIKGLATSLRNQTMSLRLLGNSLPSELAVRLADADSKMLEAIRTAQV